MFPPLPENQKRIRVAIDFDGTITSDPDTWACLIRVMQLSGWDPHIVTWRPSSLYKEVNEFISRLAIKIPVVYCNGCAKRECFEADIWFDDNPASIMFSLMRAPNFNEKSGEELLVLSSDTGVTIPWRNLEAKKTER